MEPGEGHLEARGADQFPGAGQGFGEGIGIPDRERRFQLLHGPHALPDAAGGGGLVFVVDGEEAGGIERAGARQAFGRFKAGLPAHVAAQIGMGEGQRQAGRGEVLADGLVHAKQERRDLAGACEGRLALEKIGIEEA